MKCFFLLHTTNIFDPKCPSCLIVLPSCAAVWEVPDSVSISMVNRLCSEVNKEWYLQSGPCKALFQSKSLYWFKDGESRGELIHHKQTFLRKKRDTGVYTLINVHLSFSNWFKMLQHDCLQPAKKNHVSHDTAHGIFGGATAKAKLTLLLLHYLR